jgi:PRTRC genetic system protein A
MEAMMAKEPFGTRTEQRSVDICRSEARRIEIERTLVDHFVGELPPGDFGKPIAYVLQRNGLWERRTNPLGTFCRCVAKAHIPGLPVILKEGFELAVPKMPTSILWEAIAFFRAVYFKLGTESILRVVYDRRRKAYITECPSQIVAGAGLAFEKKALPYGRLLVAEIHSHAGFDAGFSSTDDNDELGDRFYGVVGRLGEALPQVTFRLSVGGDRVRVPLDSIFILDDPIFSCSFPAEWLDRVVKHGSRERHSGLLEQLDLLADSIEDEAGDDILIPEDEE